MEIKVKIYKTPTTWWCDFVGLANVQTCGNTKSELADNINKTLAELFHKDHDDFNYDFEADDFEHGNQFGINVDELVERIQ